ncbi:5'/3'-nucleotidase SurE [Nocardioides sp. NPDC006303]|uniref:5'/3'-nucleotidase SurE n=1 Tax=Nocardioides sp. NPDC006303 TaxID=3156747 RepID=UPI00339F31EB
MHALLTNDDGFDSPGLSAIRHSLIEAGHHVTVVAPDGNRSATSHAVTIRPELTLKRLTGLGDPNAIYTCSGRPADCTRVGLFTESLWPEVDVVVSGINIGINLGDDVNMSGTVSAAAEAALHGVKAIAFSQQGTAGGAPFINHSDHEYRLTRYAARLVEALEEADAFERVFLNVNLPHEPIETTARATRLGRRYYKARVSPVRVSAGEWTVAPYASADFPDPPYEKDDGTDFNAVISGVVGVTPIDADRRPAGHDSGTWVEDIIARAGDVTLD